MDLGPTEGRGGRPKTRCVVNRKADDARRRYRRLFVSPPPEPEGEVAEPFNDMENVAKGVPYNIGQIENFVSTSLVCREHHRTLFYILMDTGYVHYLGCRLCHRRRRQHHRYGSVGDGHVDLQVRVVPAVRTE